MGTACAWSYGCPAVPIAAGNATTPSPGIPMAAFCLTRRPSRNCSRNWRKITLSGGDPLYFANRADILRLVREIKGKFPQKTVWLYTGFVWEAVEGLEIMKYVDVLVDGEFQIAQKDTQLHWRGSANQRVINVPASRAAGEAVLYCR